MTLEVLRVGIRLHRRLGRARPRQRHGSDRNVRDRKTLPAWERPNMLAKYRVTTEGTVLAAQKPPKVAERRAPK